MTALEWLVVATHVPPSGELGGVVRYTTDLISGLRQQDGVRVHVLGTRPSARVLTRLVGNPDRVHLLPAAPTVGLAAWERYAYRPPAAIDVVHGVKHLLPRRGGATTVLTAHDMLLLDRPQDFGRVKGALLPFAYRGSLRSADLVVCVSRATERRVHAALPSLRGRTATVPLATSASLLHVRPEAVPSLAGRRFALVVGDSSPRKNLRTVVDAWPRVLRSAPDAVLAVAGPASWGRTETGDAWDRLVAGGAVVPLGRVPDAELRWCYEHADVVLCPSVAEGFGLPAAEALDFGARVVVSDDDALGEAAGGRADANVAAMDGPGWADATVRALALGRRAGASVRSRTWQDVVDETVSAVRAVHASRC